MIYLRSLSFLVLFGILFSCSLITSQAQAQVQVQRTGSIEGQVVDGKSGNPLPGVQIFLEVSRQGAVSGVDGRYAISNVPIGRDNLIAKFVGFVTLEQEVSVSSDQILSIPLRLVETPILLQGIVVSATQERQTVADIAASIGRIDSETISDVNPTHPSQIMSKIPGVWVNVTEGEGHMTAIRQPLSLSPVYLFLENGVPTRSTGFFNPNALYEINIPQADAIEVIKGPGTALYGSDAIGGVISVTSGRVPATTEVGGTIEGGSYGFRRVLLTGGTTQGPNGFRIDANFTDSEGWRDATEYSRQSVTMRWDRQLGSRTFLKSVIAFSNIDQEPAGATAISESDFRDDATTNYTPVSYREVRSYRFSSAFERYYQSALLSITPFARFSSMDLLPNWALSFDPALWESQNYSVGVQLKYRKDFERFDSRIVTGADLDYSPGERTETEIEPNRDGKIYTSYSVEEAQYDYDVTYQQTSPFVHLELSPAPGFRVNAGLRIDIIAYDYRNKLTEEATGTHRRPASNTRHYSHLSPKLGVTYQLTNDLNAFFSYRHAFRVPSERQLFRQGPSVNSIDLEPVKVDNFEVGIRGRVHDGIQFEATAFTMTKKDDIVAFVFQDGSRGSVNTGETSHKGVELGMRLAPSDALTLTTAYSYALHTYELWETQLGDDLSGNEMEVAPRVILNAEASYRFPVLEGASIAIEWNRLGGYWMDPSNTSKYDGHDVFNVRASIKITDKIAILGRVGNLTDELYAERATYNRFRGDEFAPAAPRTVNISLRFGL